jgi:2-dehydropantoate 2-reductase
MRIAVVGAGAIGGFLAAALARAGEDVAVVARGAHLDAIRRDGIEVRSEIGGFTSRVRASTTLADLGAFDVALLTFKAHQWAAFLPMLEPLAQHGTPIVTLQNGVPFWFARTPALASVDPAGRIGGVFGDEAVIGGVVHQSGNVVAPGVIQQSGGVRYPMGSPNGGVTRITRSLCDAFTRAGLQPEADDAIRERVWYKLLNNASLNPVSAITGMTTHEMYADAPTLAWLKALMHETLDVGHALRLARDVDVDDRIGQAAKGSDVKTSMLQDVEAGRPTELDPIVGAVIELGERLNVPTPRLRETYDTLMAKIGT